MEHNDLIYRNEYKYLVNAAEVEIIKSRANAILMLDAHVSQAGTYQGYYNIRSVYFDDCYDSCYLENENGTDPREKFRIRIYNHSDRKITLELKRKEHGKCLKQACSLTREQCDWLLAGRVLPDSPDHPPLLRKLLLQMKMRSLRPVVIVEYDRIPYVFPAGNVRVTLDLQISASNQCQDFFSEDLHLRPILPENHHVLEVKWDEVLPDFVCRNLMLERLQWSNFSKYYLCRKIEKEPYYVCTSKMSSKTASSMSCLL